MPPAATVTAMILVTGAAGTVGRHVVRLLQQGGHPVRAMIRNSSGPIGAEVVRADFEDRESLRRAVTGVRAVFLLTAPAVPSADHDLALLAAARDAGVAMIVKLSAIGTGDRFEGVTIGVWHLAAEQAIRASGMAWTILRPSSFASNVMRWVAGEPVPNLTGDGRQGVVDPRDIAAVAVAALTGPAHAGRLYTLTGPELLSVPDQARQWGEIIGRPVATVDVLPAEAAGRMLAAGMHPAAVDAVVTGSAWARAGHNAVLTGDVEQVLGRPAVSFRDWAMLSITA